MDDTPLEDGTVRFLRRLVTALTLVMIAGFIVLIALLVTRFPDMNSAAVPLPAQIALPSGEMAEAVTATATWYAVVTASGKILVYDRATEALIQTVEITLP